MVNAKSGVPRGYQAVMPYLRVRDAASAIKFYKKVFGASERYRLKMGGKIGHAELDVGGSTLMISDEFPEVNAIGPKALKGTSVALTIYVDDVDKVVAKAVKAGAKVRRRVADQFYGDRMGQIEDPFGHIWSIQTRIEKVAPKDMQKRLNSMLKAQAAEAVARRASGRAGAGGRGAKSAKPARAASSAKAVKATKAAKAEKATKKSPARKAPAKKRSASKAVAGAPTAKKAAARKSSARKSGARKSPAPRKTGPARAKKAGRGRKAAKA